MTETLPNPQEKRLWVLFALGIIGLILSLVQTSHYYDLHLGIAGFKSFCDLGGNLNCDAVAMSDYATFLGLFPLSSVAAGWFLTLAALSYLAKNPFWYRDSVRVLFALSSVSLIFSAFYAYVMAVKIQQYCVPCLVVDGLNIVAWIIAFTLKPEPLSKAKPEPQQVKAIAYVTVAAFVVTIMGGMIFLSQKGISQSDINMYTQSIQAGAVENIPLPPDAPAFGSDSAKVTIVKFSDFQCPACKMGAFSLHPVLKKFGDKVRFVFINFPLDQKCNRHVQSEMHPAACEAAKVGYCANKMGKFQLVYELFFEEQDNMRSTSPLQLAVRAGLNEGELKACVASPETEKAVVRDIEIASNTKVAQTPTFFINGKRVEGAMPPEVWTQLIEQLL